MQRIRMTEQRRLATRTTIKLVGSILALLIYLPPTTFAETPTSKDNSSEEVVTDTAEKADTAQKADAVPDEEDGWRPELGLGFVLHVQDLEGSATSNFMDLGKPNSDQAISPGFRFSLALSSPVLIEDSEWKPRVFVHTAVQYLLEDSYTAYRGFSSENRGFTDSGTSPNCDVPQYGENVRGDGSSGTGSAPYENIYAQLPQLWREEDIVQGGVVIKTVESYAQINNFDGIPNTALNATPPGTPFPNGFATGGFAIGGSDCNSNTRATTSINAMWILGAGLEVTLPVLSRQFHLRASADYVGQSFGSINGSWDRQNSFDVCTSSAAPASPFAYCVDPPTGQSITHPKFTSPRISQTGSVDGFTTHALGAGVQLDVDVYKKGDLRLSLFLELRVAWLMSQPEANLHMDLPDQIFNDVNCANNPGSAYQCDYLAEGGPSVDFKVLPDEFIAQGGGGIRILWAPPW
ncbi:MAG: hypothetical protein P8Q97_12255 [Myxococcota bacterium]|nr:hypothetical protein [Myxococcota bacterium]